MTTSAVVENERAATDVSLKERRGMTTCASIGKEGILPRMRLLRKEQDCHPCLSGKERGDHFCFY